MKEKSLFVCGECGYESAKWMGKCPQCGSWNTLVEEERVAAPRAAKKPASAVPLSLVAVRSEARVTTGIGELDRVLGGGLVQGMAVLLGGDPGIGKSTLLMQAADALCPAGTVLYVSGEESASQLKLRAGRIGVKHDPLLFCDTSLENILAEAEKQAARFLFVDSIQTMQAEGVPSAAGSVTQVRTCTAELVRYAKETGTIVLIVGHVTKDGAIAGPRVLEHIVDTVLYFEGDRLEGLRLLRAVKNRFGSTNELGVFEMRDSGMACVDDPTALFLSGTANNGVAVTCAMEGQRPLLCEVQSLLVPSSFQSPRRAASGIGVDRLNLMLAVLIKKARLDLGMQDVYINVAGNLRLGDRGSDLALCLCVASQLLDVTPPAKAVAIGEVGLTGEVRAVAQMDTRIRECVRLGYTDILVPRGTRHADGARLIPVADVAAAIRVMVGQKKDGA